MTPIRVIPVLVTVMFVFPDISVAELHEVAIPDASDWVEKGIALQAGAEDSWDSRLYGQISPCSVIQKEGIYYLYYVGADGDRSTDRGPSHRALGLATSPDGIHFQKVRHNPILTHLPHNNQEEGIFSAGTTLNAVGDILLYYGAIWAANSETESVQSNGALARSSNGLHYEDHSYVFSWDDPSVWGHGDELFPLGAFFSHGKYYVYYGAKSAEISWGIGLAIGDSPTHFSRFVKVQDEQREIIGGCDPVRISEDRIALFVLKDFEKNVLEVITAPLDHPEKWSPPIKTYNMFPPRFRHTTVYLDRQREKWFMYQASDMPEDGNRIVVRTAPMNRIKAR
jgi:hypothetical protein